LQEDLITLTSGGIPLRPNGSKVLVRPATPEETAVFAGASMKSEVSDDLFVAYLVGLDGHGHTDSGL
jgi:hypothetical protein